MIENKIIYKVFLLLMVVYLLTASFRIESGDGERMYQVACHMVMGQGFFVQINYDEAALLGPSGKGISIEQLGGGDGYGLWGRDGRYYTWFGIGWSLFAAPFCLIGKVIAQLIPYKPEGFISQVSVMFLNPFLTACTGVLLYRLARRFYPIKVSLGISLIYGIGTIAWYYSKSAASEPLVVFLLLLAINLIEEDKLILSGSAMGIMLLTKQTSIFLVAPLVVWVFARQFPNKRWFQKIILLIIPLAIGQLLVFVYNAYRFGNPFEYGYRGIAWDTPILTGLYGQLLSPGKGLLIFMPVLILGILGWRSFWKQNRVWGSLFFGLVIAFLIPHALYNYWEGGGGWGPRLLLPIIPFILLPAGMIIQQSSSRRYGQLALAFIVALSVIIQILGVSVNWARHLQNIYERSSSAAEYYDKVVFHWAYSPILGQIQSLREVVSILRMPSSLESLLKLVSHSISSTPAGDWPIRAVNLLSMNLPDSWFFYLYFLGVPIIYLAIIAALLVLSGFATWKALLSNLALLDIAISTHKI